ncbi:ATP-binding protein [Pseudomonas aeruginosa]|nr:ATP-binding protein [Pseudomonas aeruginosa]ELR9615939.1 ATP-binding protein [Pseudomonas aeruginosa]
MAFSNKLADGFGKVIEQSQYMALDPIVKSNFVSKGRNLIFGRSGNAEPRDLLYLGKVLETATGTSFLGADAYLDTGFPHVIYITGTRGSGKSMDLGVLLEGLNPLAAASPVALDVTPVSTFLIDTQSQFWTLRYAPQGNEGARQLDQLTAWNLKPLALARTKVFVPPGAISFMGDEIPLKIRPRDVLHEEWCGLLGQDVYSPQGHLLSEVLGKLEGRDFEVEDMLRLLREGSFSTTVAEVSRNTVIYRLTDYSATGLFGADGLSVEDMLVAGQCNIFMLRDLRDEDKALVTALLARQLFTIMGRYHQQRRISDFFKKDSLQKSFPSRVWLLVDEAHVVCPSQGDSPARSALVEYVKRGRDAGLSLVLATQQPSAVDDRVLSQVNLSFSHRLTFQSDINAAMARIPTKIPSGMRVAGNKVNEFGDVLRLLEAGQCFIGDHATSRAVLLQMRPRITAHGGQSPI